VLYEYSKFISNLLNLLNLLYFRKSLWGT